MTEPTPTEPTFRDEDPNSSANTRSTLLGRLARRLVGKGEKSQIKEDHVLSFKVEVLDQEQTANLMLVGQTGKISEEFFHPAPGGASVLTREDNPALKDGIKRSVVFQVSSGGEWIRTVVIHDSKTGEILDVSRPKGPPSDEYRLAQSAEEKEHYKMAPVSVRAGTELLMVQAQSGDPMPRNTEDTSGDTKHYADTYSRVLDAAYTTPQ